MGCVGCPRRCNVDRSVGVGYCKEGEQMRLGRVMLHHFEEPCISGTIGSGAIFFSGCALRCCYCQNYELVAERKGKAVSETELCDIILRLQDEGAHNINLVNPTHFCTALVSVLQKVKHKLNIPVVYNTGGYDRVNAIESLDGLVDIYLPDLKYCDPTLANRYSNAPNYFEVATQAIKAMYQSVGEVKYSGELLKKGVIIRHLILPKAHHDSIAIMEWIAGNLPRELILVSLMSQYTPYHIDDIHPELNRKIYSYEYKKVLERVDELNLNGYMQEKTSAEVSFTPRFDFSGI